MTEDATPETTESTDTDEPAAEDRSVIRAGRNFEEEFHLDAEEAGRFLVDLGEQLRSGDELTVETDEWELPFSFDEPVDVEIDFEGVGDPELEIEVELRGTTDDAPTVE
jgi:amphi-Trp domain-containing protein